MRQYGRALAAAVILPVILCAQGCERKSAAKIVDGRPHVRIGWIGLVCEAPLFAAYENGYFKEEGLDPEMVKTDWDSFQAGMSFSRFDVTHTLQTYLLKPIEQGLDVKITAGVHRGCLRIQAGINTKIHSIEDLRGKRIAVSTMGGPPMIFATRVLAHHGIDVQKEITWLVYPGDLTELALRKDQVDAVADSEPIGSLLVNHKCVRTIADQMLDEPYSNEFCCVVVVNGPLARQSPEIAAKLTRAILRGSKWVGTNPRAAARIEVEKHYISKANVELNAAVLTKLRYEPAVASSLAGLELQCQEMKAAHVLNESTDPHELAQRAWLKLDGVSDDWIAKTSVAHLDGDGPLYMDPLMMAQLVAKNPTCCQKCCIGE
jgi:NitT/TauT family transport system substrate-binding protein